MDLGLVRGAEPCWSIPTAITAAIALTLIARVMSNQSAEARLAAEKSLWMTFECRCAYAEGYDAALAATPDKPGASDGPFVPRSSFERVAADIWHNEAPHWSKESLTGKVLGVLQSYSILGVTPVKPSASDKEIVLKAKAELHRLCYIIEPTDEGLDNILLAAIQAARAAPSEDAKRHPFSCNCEMCKPDGT